MVKFAKSARSSASFHLLTFEYRNVHSAVLVGHLTQIRETGYRKTFIKRKLVVLFSTPPPTGRDKMVKIAQEKKIKKLQDGMASFMRENHEYYRR